MWSGAIADIPEGWKLCDGNNDTPDLKGKFIVGAGNSYSVDDTGGSVLHSHPFTGSLHQHNIVAGNDIAAGANSDVTVAIKRPSGTTDIASFTNPYHALCYIMKK